MRLCLVLCIISTVALSGAEPSLRTPVQGSSVSNPIRQKQRPVSSPQCSPGSLLSTDQSLQQQLVTLQQKVDLMASDLIYTRQKVVQSSLHIEQLMRFFIKTSCTDVAAGDPMVGAPMPASSSVSRQNSMEGVYAIYPPSGTPKRVKCDHASTGDPGWTVVLLRETGGLDFNRTHNEYSTGFGNPASEVWIGLDTLHALTASEPQQLRVELRTFAGQFAYAHYNQFSVGAKSSHYKLSVGAYHSQSTAGDALKDHNNMLFSTIDVDQDKEAGSCANMFGGGGGWWYAKCYHALGTGRYRKPTRPNQSQTTVEFGGVTWHPFNDVKKSLQMFKMLIKPKDV